MEQYSQAADDHQTDQAARGSGEGGLPHRPMSEELLQLGFEDVQPPFFPIPKAAEALAAMLERENLLVLAGCGLREKDRLAAHLAWLLHRNLKGAGKLFAAYQLHASKLTSRIELKRKLQGEGRPLILLLSDLEPHQVQFDLQNLRNLARSFESYLIVTTETFRSDWQVGDQSAETSLLIEPTEAEWFDSAYLRSVLCGLLERCGQDKPAKLAELVEPGKSVSETKTLAGVPVDEIALQLRAPGQVLEFVEWLCTYPYQIDGQRLREKLGQLGGQAEAVKRWYQQLTPRQQLLAAAAVLFEGVLDDQFFALLEILWPKVWDSRLERPLFDYEDLRPLQTYFQGVSSTPGLQVVQVVSAEARWAILEVAWLQHRRTLVAALSEAHDLIHRSLAVEARVGFIESALMEAATSDEQAAAEPEGMLEEMTGATREAFGSLLRRDALRSAIQHAWSRFGAYAWDGLDSMLKQAAKCSNARVQLVAASALADWRSPEYRHRPDLAEKLFDKLKRWNDRAYVRESLGLRPKGHGPKGDEIFSHIRATVVLAVSQAALYDLPDQLDARLQALFLRFLDDSDRVVRDRFANIAIPLVVSRHLFQLETVLRTRFLRDNSLLPPIAQGIAQAYELRPRETAQLLERWYDVWMSAVAPEKNSSWRMWERQLVVALMVYGAVDCREAAGELSTSTVFRKLERVLAEQRPIGIRVWAIEAAMRQAKRDFAAAAAPLASFLAEVTLAERTRVVGHFVKIYAAQREQLHGGDRMMVREGVAYELWSTAERPLTQVEFALRRWLLDVSNPIAQQVAIDSLEAFAGTAIDRREREVRMEGPLSSTPLSEVAVSGPAVAESFERLRSAGFWAWLAIWVHGGGKAGAGTVRAIFPEFLHLVRTKSYAETLLAELSRQKDRGISAIARELVSVRAIYRLRWLAIPLLGYCVYLVAG